MKVSAYNTQGIHSTLAFNCSLTEHYTLLERLKLWHKTEIVEDAADYRSVTSDRTQLAGLAHQNQKLCLSTL